MPGQAMPTTTTSASTVSTSVDSSTGSGAIKNDGVYTPSASKVPNSLPPVSASDSLCVLGAQPAMPGGQGGGAGHGSALQKAAAVDVRFHGNPS